MIESGDNTKGVEGTRQEISSTLDQVQALGKHRPDLDLQSRVRCEDSCLSIEWTSLPGEKLCVTFFVKGIPKPITIQLGDDGDGREVFSEEVLGFNPETQAFNYMFHPAQTSDSWAL